MSFIFVTHSQGKLAEAERILGYKPENQYIDLPEMQAVEVEEVVILKAKSAYDELKKPVMIEDTGLFVEVWNGLPGALIKWFIERVGDSGICTMLRPYSNRRAKAKSVVATYDGRHEPIVFVGEVEGVIASTPAGEQGFGWDKIFIPEGATLTFGQMSAEEKDQYSMRSKAFNLMRSYYAEKRTLV